MDNNYGFSKEEIAAMTKHFAVFDVDGDGHVTFVELQKVFKQMNARVTPSTIMELIREVDINRNGSIEFDEFVRLHWRLKKGGTSAWARLLEMTRPKEPEPPKPPSSRDVEQGQAAGRQQAQRRLDVSSSITNLAGQASNLLSRAREATDRFLGLSQQSINEDQWNQYSFFERRDVQRPPQQPNALRRSLTNLVRSASRVSLHDQHQLLTDEMPTTRPPRSPGTSNVLINMERLSSQALPSPRSDTDDDGFSSDSYEFYSDIDETSDGETPDQPVQRIVVRTSMDRPPSMATPTQATPPSMPVSSAAVQGPAQVSAPPPQAVVQAPARPSPLVVPVYQVVPQGQMSPRAGAVPLVQPVGAAPVAAPYYGDQGAAPPAYVGAPMVRPAPAAAAAGVWTAARAEDDHHDHHAINSEAFYDARLARRAQAQRSGQQPSGDRRASGQAQQRRPKTRSMEELSRRQRRERNATVRRPRHQPVVLQEPEAEQYIGAGPPPRNRTPWLMILLMFVYTGLLVYAIISEGGIQPMAINFMAGPSNVKIIQLGAKYEPCMRMPGAATRAHFGIESVHDPVVCPSGYTGERYANSTTLCEYVRVMEYVCGGQFPDDVPDQWWRFISPIFLHTGIIHLAIMLALHIWIGLRLERDLGTIRIFLVYFIAGILGNIFAAYAAPLQVSAGSNGAMYGLFGLLYLDLFQNWQVLVSPIKNLIFLTFCFLAALAIGLLPYIDNFAHIGGFGGGIIAGLLFVPTVTFGKWDGRRKRILAILAFPTLVAIYFVGIWRFYNEPDSTCDWCGWLDCVPQGSAWCS